MTKFTKGARVRAIDAKEFGIPITEGEVYTVKATLTAKQIAGRTGEATIAERAHIPGITLEEVGGYFMATRFEPE